MAWAISIADCGERAPWLALVHGMSQDHRVFDRQVQAFRDRFNLLLVDLPGHGLAAAVGGPYGHVEFTRHVGETIEQHGITSTHYWGTHTGATVGLLLAATRPDLVQSLILEGPVLPGRNPPVVQRLMAAAKAEMQEKGLEAARALWWSQSCWFDHMRSDPSACRAIEHHAIIAGFNGAPWRDASTPAPIDAVEEQLQSILQPTLIYNGALDHHDFLNASEMIAACIPHVARELIPDAGGFPAWERPDAVNATVADFLSGL